MIRLWRYSPILWALALGACGDQQQPTATPELKVITDPLQCDFLAAKNLINSYFTSPTQQDAQGFESLMENGGAQSPAAIENGFKIMNLIGQASRTASPPSATVGSDLTKALTKCMFNAHAAEYMSLADNGGLNAVRFDLALNAAGGGVYYVVGQNFDVADGIPRMLKGAIGTAAALSKVAPGPATGTPPNVTLGSWTSLLAGNTFEGGRALIYGYRVTASPLAYEWATIDPLTDFSPHALVSICDGNAANDVMVLEGNVGALAYDTANLCDLADATGKTVTGFRSQFSNKTVTTLNLVYQDSPKNPWKISTQGQGNPISVQVSVDEGLNSTVGVFGVCVYLTATNNNGQPTGLESTLAPEPKCQAPPVAGVPFLSVLTKLSGHVEYTLADFGLVRMTKTGGLALTVTGDVVDRSGGGSLVTKINVKP